MPDETPPPTFDLDAIDYTKPAPANWAQVPPDLSWDRVAKVTAAKAATAAQLVASEAARQAAEAAVAAEAAKLTPLQSRLAELESQLSAKDERVLALETGITDPAIYDIAGARFAAYKAAAGDKAVDKRTWLMGEGRADPILARLLAPAPAAAPPIPPKAPTLQAPATEPPPAAKLDAAQIAALRRQNGGRLPQETLDALLKEGLTWGQ